ncbi:ATP-binding protein [Ekhidna sp.]|uniref:tetratricopeptide repeat-containing sensor histidine kinase n=1 Tax=Ekhidna sp. TaxID=2608089 RepID=UPI003B50774B
MVRSIKILHLLFFLVLHSSAQVNLLESELTDEANSTNIDLLHKLTEHYSVKDSTKAIEYVKLAIGMSQSINDDERLARAYLDYGYIYQEHFNYELAENWFEKSETIYSSLESERGVALVAQARGLAQVKQGYHEESLQSFRKALRGFLQSNDQEAMLKTYYNIGYAHYRIRDYDSTTYYYFQVLPHCDDSLTQNCIDVYNQLGTTYTEIKEYKKANDYLKLALAGSLGKGDTVSAGNATMNIAGNYFFQQKLDSCAIFLSKAIAMYDATGNKQGQVIGLNNLSIIYEENGELEKALVTAKTAIQAAKSINDRNIMAGSYLQVMDLSRKLKDMNQSLVYGDSAITTIKELKSKYHFQQYYLSLSEAYTDLNDYKSALEYKDLYYAYTDSMLNEQKNKQIAELETKYETEKKEQEIELLNTEKELQAAVIKNNRASIFILIALLAGLIVIGFWLFKRNQYKQRVMLEKERTRLKEEQIRAVIQSQEKERKRFAMDLHDDFGQLISALKLNVMNTKSQTTEKSETILDNMYSSLKNIAFDLMPHTLFEKGLEQAIEELKEQINADGSLKVDFQSFDIKNQIDDEQKVAIYRVVQELVSNIIKYSNATKLNISITDINHGISLIVEDNGDGFDLNQFKHGKGNGWKNIHSRLDLLHGEIEFDTQPGRKNTTVIIEIPYLKQKAEAA